MFSTMVGSSTTYMYIAVHCGVGSNAAALGLLNIATTLIELRIYKYLSLCITGGFS